ncbi:TetR family transcriptional regulator [Streptomyces sp. NPDC048825]|uniref:TetR family transcriptional regulator n=1 Tax=Streptomyces sp. NPDC048825 TaxID=3365592 RepID=UPI0037195E5D
MEQRQYTLRDRKRRAVQDDVAGIAVDLFVANGYEDTTVDQIATAAGLSPRTFFRYFASKEAVVTHMFDTTGTDIADALAERPSEEAPWLALRRSFDGLIQQLTERPASVPLIRMIYDTPSLYAGHLHKQVRWIETIAGALALRLPQSLDADERRLRAGALASAGVACLEYARLEWIAGDGKGAMAKLLDVAMSAVSPLPEE